MTIGDFNSDDNDDVALVTTGSTQLFLGNGSGNLSGGATLSSGSSQAMAIGDFNGDGFADLTTVGPDTGQILLVNGSGSFNSTGQDLAESNSQAVAIGDFDGDIDLNIFIVNAPTAGGLSIAGDLISQAEVGVRYQAYLPPH